MFVPGKPFHPNLMLMGKRPGAYLRVERLKGTPTRGKHSCLFQTFGKLQNKKVLQH